MKSFQSGIRLPSGQPWWQKGTPQSMQRDACARNSPSAYGRYTSRQSCTRSRTGRYGCFCRWISMNPVTLPMNDLEIRQHDWREFDLAELRFPFEHALVVARHHLHEQLRRDGPIRQQLACQRALRVPDMALEQFLHELRVVIFLEQLELDELRIAAPWKCRLRIVDVRDAAAHAGREIASGFSQDDDASACHVLAAVIADALDDGYCAAVANCEPLARDSPDVGFAARRAVQRDVADDDVLFGRERRRPRRHDDKLSAGQSLAKVVVSVAFQRQRDAPRYERTEALPSRSREANPYRVVRQAPATTQP